MNDVNMQELEEHIRDHIGTIPDRPTIDALASTQREQRAFRRAAAINIMTLARSHAGRQEEMYTQNEADVLMAIMELLDRVAAG